MTLRDKACCMLNYEGLAKVFWAESFEHVTNYYKRTEAPESKMTAPMEALLSSVPNVQITYIWMSGLFSYTQGESCWIIITKADGVLYTENHHGKPRT